MVALYNYTIAITRSRKSAEKMPKMGEKREKALYARLKQPELAHLSPFSTYSPTSPSIGRIRAFCVPGFRPLFSWLIRYAIP